MNITYQGNTYDVPVFGWMNHLPEWLKKVVRGFSDKYIGSNFLAEEAAEKNWDQIWKMWNETNSYNSPMNQMKLAREAGLNVGMLYGQPVSESQPMSGFAEASGANGSGDLLRDVRDFDLLQAQKELLESQKNEIESRIPERKARIEKLNADREKAIKEAESIGMHNEFFAATMPSEIDKVLAGNELSAAESRAAMKYVNDLAEANYQMRMKELDEMDKKIASLEADNEYKKELKNEVTQAIKNMKEEFKSLKAKAEIDEFQAKNKEADFWLTRLTNAWSLAAIGVSQLQKHKEKIKSAFGQFGWDISSQYQSGGITPALQ